MVEATKYEFRALVGDQKFVDLNDTDITETLDYEVAQFLKNELSDDPTQRNNLRVLDFGCGRGRLVGQLRMAGWSAFGVDVDERFTRSGYILDEKWPGNSPILAALDGDGRTSFPDQFFDAIISDTVLEHVSDLDRLAAEMRRIIKPGGVLFHRFPGRWNLIEPHYFLPFVHWLPPRSIARHATARFLLALGLGVKFPFPLRTADKAHIICQYADTHTFYRSHRKICAIFENNGIRLDFGRQMRWCILVKLKDKFHVGGISLALAKMVLRSNYLTKVLGELRCWHVTGFRLR